MARLDAAIGASWPLAGLRVLDLGTEITAGYATKLLVDAGADAIHVEHPGGDPLRRWTAAMTPLAPGEDGPLHRFLRASNRSVVADAGTDAGHRRILELAARADVVIRTPAPGSDGAPGPEELLGANPRLVVVSVTPWGTTGPWAGRPATEATVQAACGATGRRGLRDRTPVTAGGRIGEWLTASFAAVGALVGWLHARDTGRGQHVDVSMLEALTLCLNGPYQLIAAQWYPQMEVRRSIDLPSIHPAVDGMIGFCTQTGQQWKDFTVLLGRPDLGEDPTLLAVDARNDRLDELAAAIEAVTTTCTVDELVELAVALRIPVTPVGTGATVRAFDHLVERGVYVENPAGFVQPRTPYRLSAATTRPPGTAPALGADDADAGWPARPVAAPERPDAARSFAGLRVVDLTAFWAGPFATAVLAAMGADVVKVESITRPDGIRFLGGFAGDAYWERSMVFHGANPGKRDVTLDLDTASGRDLLWRLIDRADVVIENFTPRVLDAFQVTWGQLHRRNPRAILVRMPAFGLDGPWRDRAGFAMTIEQTSGLAWVTGYEDVRIVPRGPCDPLGGLHAVVALVAALEHRRRSGEGQLVEVPLLEAALNIAAEQVLEHQRTGEVLGTWVNRSPYAAPQGLYPTAGDDRWLCLAAATDEQWRALAAVLGRGDLAADPDLASAAGRRRYHDRIDAAIATWSAGLDGATAADVLTAAGVPAAAVTRSHEAHRNPQLEHRRFLQLLDHPVTGTSGYPGFAMRFGAFGDHLYSSPPPRLGQHNAEVLAELGLSADEIAALAAAGVIGDRPAVSSP